MAKSGRFEEVTLIVTRVKRSKSEITDPSVGRLLPSALMLDKACYAKLGGDEGPPTDVVITLCSADYMPCYVRKRTISGTRLCGFHVCIAAIRPQFMTMHSDIAC